MRAPLISSISFALLHYYLWFAAPVSCERAIYIDLLAGELACLAAHITLVSGVGLDQSAWHCLLQSWLLHQLNALLSFGSACAAWSCRPSLNEPLLTREMAQSDRPPSFKKRQQVPELRPALAAWTNTCRSGASNSAFAQSDRIALTRGRKLNDSLGDHLYRRIGSVDEPQLTKRTIEGFREHLNLVRSECAPLQ
jgi:hypothetical protein